MSDNKALGLYGQQIAITRLELLGYEILVVNYRVRRGEIDIIALKDRVLTFVEVKYRTDTSLGLPGEALTKKKLSSFRRATAAFLQESSYTNYNELKFMAICILDIFGNDLSIDVLEDILGP